MTAPAGGEPRGDAGKPAYPLLVRVAGRWLCRHDLAAVASAERPQPRP